MAAPCGCPLCSSPFITGERRADAVEPCGEPIARRRITIADLRGRDAAFSADAPMPVAMADKEPREFYAAMIERVP
ncbi:hypothetical protein [Rhodopseudomonas sp. B29]|uniref:hypothetical protein n=1 Tax=Rhodopseudomonas sp. B29 TaxID=95607 RepID=UPI0003495700|nr:hypothetical protein [Rhodopseudomonas sp. B29]